MKMIRFWLLLLVVLMNSCAERENRDLPPGISPFLYRESADLREGEGNLLLLPDGARLYVPPGAVGPGKLPDGGRIQFSLLDMVLPQLFHDQARSRVYQVVFTDPEGAEVFTELSPEDAFLVTLPVESNGDSLLVGFAGISEEAPPPTPHWLETLPNETPGKEASFYLVRGVTFQLFYPQIREEGFSLPAFPPAAYTAAGITLEIPSGYAPEDTFRISRRSDLADPGALLVPFPETALSPCLEIELISGDNSPETLTSPDGTAPLALLPLQANENQTLLSIQELANGFRLWQMSPGDSLLPGRWVVLGDTAALVPLFQRGQYQVAVWSRPDDYVLPLDGFHRELVFPDLTVITPEQLSAPPGAGMYWRENTALPDSFSFQGIFPLAADPLWAMVLEIRGEDYEVLDYHPDSLPLFSFPGANAPPDLALFTGGRVESLHTAYCYAAEETKLYRRENGRLLVWPLTPGGFMLSREFSADSLVLPLGGEPAFLGFHCFHFTLPAAPFPGRRLVWAPVEGLGGVETMLQRDYDLEPLYPDFRFRYSGSWGEFQEVLPAVGLISVEDPQTVEIFSQWEFLDCSLLYPYSPANAPTLTGHLSRQLPHWEESLLEWWPDRNAEYRVAVDHRQTDRSSRQCTVAAGVDLGLSLGKNQLLIPGEFLGGQGEDQLPGQSPVELRIPDDFQPWEQFLPPENQEILSVLEVGMDSTVHLLQHATEHERWPLVAVAFSEEAAGDSLGLLFLGNGFSVEFRRNDSLYNFLPPDFIIDRDQALTWCPGAGTFLLVR